MHATNTRIDLSQYFPLDDPRASFPGRGGRPVALQTKFRWALRGVGGVRLKTLKIGQRLCTTEPWIAEFLAALNRGRTDVLPATDRSVAEQARRHQVDAALDEAGL